MAKEERRGDREIRNPKAKSAVAGEISPIAVKSRTGAGARSSASAEAKR